MMNHLRQELDSKAWGQKIRELREEKDWSQRDLAQKLGVHHTTISEIERGRTQFTLERLNRIVEALGYRGVVELEPLEEQTRAEWGPIRREEPDLRRRVRTARRLAERCAEELYAEYEVDRVYSFGSLAERGASAFGEDSDIDLLVDGLDASKLFEAEGRLELEVVESSDAFREFGFDLVRSEDVDLNPAELVANGEAVSLPEN